MIAPTTLSTQSKQAHKEIRSIDDVISALENIILESERDGNPLGYFAVLYQKVTKKVKEGIENNFFDDSPRMEQLDIIFAQRYLEAYYAYQKSEPVTASWKKAFELSGNFWPIVLQHLLIGINAHINLDLGIAAAEVCKDKNIDELENDFIKINDILSSLVSEVQNDLAGIWPALKFVLKSTGRADDFLVDFSMKVARDGAWKFAKRIANLPPYQLVSYIESRDQKVARKAGIITNPGIFVKVILSIIRIGERGAIADRIQSLR